MSLNSGETLQPFRPLNQLIYDSAGNLIGIQNDRANGSDLRIGGGSGVDGTFATLVATTALKLNSGAVFELYNTADQTTNYERLRADWSGNIARIWTQNDGTGSERALRVGTVTSDGLTGPTVYTVWQGASLPYIDSVIPSSSSTSASGYIRFQSGNFNASSGTQTFLNIAPVFAQTGTAAGIALLVNPSGTYGSAGGKLQSWQTASSEVAYMNTVGSFFTIGVLRTVSGLNFGSTLGASDLEVVRDAADTLAQRRGTNAQAFRVYNTYTDGSNNCRWDLSWNTTTAIMRVAGVGTSGNGNLAVGNAALATSATVGYFMIPSSAGAPTGVPADIPTGQVALHFDSTNNKLYVYDGGWLSTAALT